MRYNQPYSTSDIPFGIIVVFGSIIAIVLVMLPVKEWWIFGENNVPKILEDGTLLNKIYELYPAILVLAFLFIVILGMWRMK